MTTVTSPYTPPVAPPGPQNDTGRMRWTVTAAGLIAMTTLYMNSGGLPLLIAMALGMLASYVIPARLNDRTMLRWVIRIGLLFIIFILNQEVPADTDFSIGGARSRNLFGMFYASEILVQCWRQSADPARPRIISLTASAMLMLTASNSFNERYVIFLAPLYLVLASMAFYGYRPRSRSIRTEIGRTIALFVALGIGFGGYRVLYINKGNLTEFGNRLLGERFRFDGTGMASQPQLGATFDLRGSTARVLRVEHLAGDPHLRGMAFDTYRNGRWGPSFQERAYKAVGPNDLRPSTSRVHTIVEMQITRLVSDNLLVYAPLQTVNLDRGEGEDMEWSWESGGPMRSRARAPYEYRATVTPEETYQGLLATPLTQMRRDRWLQIADPPDPRIRQLAERITAGMKTDQQKITAVTAYLILNHSYSLTFTPGSERDPLADFLLSDPKKGAHCEYFGTAAAMLLRYVGVPTRYVTGYFAHESAGPEITIVRQRDAHAWCEAWIKGVGWVTVDATPGDGRPDNFKEPIERWRVAWEWFQDQLQTFSDWVARLTPEQVAIGVAFTIVGGVVFGFLRYSLKRRSLLLVTGIRYASPDDRLSGAVTRFEAIFAKQSVPFPASRTYTEHLDDLATRTPTEENPEKNMALLPPLVEIARRFVRYYEEARFGNRIDEATVRAMTQLLEEMEQATR